MKDSPYIKLIAISRCFDKRIISGLVYIFVSLYSDLFTVVNDWFCLDESFYMLCADERTVWFLNLYYSNKGKIHPDILVDRCIMYA